MKAISVINATAEALASGAQSMLAMTWPTAHRGPLLIVGVESIREALREPHVGTTACIVDVTDCRPMTPADQKVANIEYEPHHYVWLLANTRPVSAAAVRGERFIYDVTDELLGKPSEIKQEARGEGVIATADRRGWKQALDDAEAFRALFPRDAYERWEFAGSVRRRMPDVKDIEHVVIPAFGDIMGGGLFAQRVNLVWHHLDAALARLGITKHSYINSKTGAVSHRWGDKYRGVDFRGWNQEIFSADVENWGSVFAIHTGPGEFSRMMVTVMQRNGHMNCDGYVLDKSMTFCKCGWSGAEPLWIPRDDFEKTGLAGGIRRAPGRDEEAWAVCPDCSIAETLSMRRVPVPTEEDYFRICGVPFTPPEQRFAPAASFAGRAP